MTLAEALLMMMNLIYAQGGHTLPDHPQVTETVREAPAATVTEYGDGSRLDETGRIHHADGTTSCVEASPCSYAEAFDDSHPDVDSIWDQVPGPASPAQAPVERLPGVLPPQTPGPTIEANG